MQVAICNRVETSTISQISFHHNSLHHSCTRSPFPSPLQTNYISLHIYIYICSSTSSMKIFSDENSSRLSRHPARWPSFRDSKISAFGNSSPSRPWISDSLTGNRKRKGKLSKGIGYAKETASLTRFSTREWIRLRWDEIRPGKTFRFRIPRASTRTKCSLLRHKVEMIIYPRLDSERMGSSMRGEFLGIEARLRVRKRAKWRGECERETLARLWWRASIRISNTFLVIYLHDKEYSSFAKVSNKVFTSCALHRTKE